MLFERRQKTKIVVLNNNRYTEHNKLSKSEGTVKVKGRDFLTVPEHALINEETGKVMYFVNRDDNQTFNPSSVKKDLDLFSKAVINFGKLYDGLIDDVRESQGDLEPGKEVEIFKSMRQRVYDFKADKKIESDNINAPPSAQQAIMSDDVVKGLARTESLPPLYSACLIGVGIAIGLIIGAWILGDTYNQQDYIQNDNYYRENDNNDTIVISMIQLPEVTYKDYQNAMNYLHENGKDIISVVLIAESAKRMVFP